MSTSDASSASGRQELTTSPPALPRPGAVWAWALAAGTVVALASWWNGELFYNYYQPSLRAMADPYNFEALNRERSVADSRNTALAYGFLASALGVALGLAGGLAGRSIARGFLGGAAGALLGCAASAGLGFFLMPVFRAHLDPESPTTVVPLLVHAAIWLAAGAGGGLAFGAGLGGRSTALRCSAGGLAGSLLGTAVYELIVDLAFPMERFDDLIGPTSVTRLLAFACVSLFVALGSAAAATLAMGRAIAPLHGSAPDPERSPAASLPTAWRRRGWRHAWIAILPLLLAMTVWRANQKTPQPRLATQPLPGLSLGPKTAFDEYASMVSEFESADTKTALAIESATTDDERLARLERRRSDRSEYARRFLKLAEDHGQEPGSVESLVWVIANASSSSEAARAIDLLERDHLKSDGLGSACEPLSLQCSERAETALRAIARTNPRREIQARAQLGLAQSLACRSDLVAQNATAAADLRREAEALFEQVIARYPDESDGQESMAEIAAHDLLALRTLSIGKVAPEIDEKDLDVKPARLSDYRGRVVVLEFWGNW